MSSYQETILQLSEMESRFQSGFSSSDRQFLELLHNQIFGTGITNKGCSDCYRDAYIIIVNHLKTTKKMPSKPNYILKAGALIHPAGTSKFYGNPLPSDDIAEEHLSKFPKEIIKFAYYPDDWEERVEAYKARKLAEKSEADLQGDETPDKSTQKTVRFANSSDEKLADKDKEIESLKSRLAESEDALALANQRLTEAEGQVSRAEAEKTELLQLVEDLKSANDASGEELSDEESEETVSLRMELETVKTELESANETIEKLKTDNRALKAANTRLKNNGAKDTE